MTPVPAWILGTIAALLAVIAFQGALVELVRRWTTQEEYSHGFLIPVVAAWLLWTRRDALLASVGAPAWSSVPFIFLAMIMNALGVASAILILSQLGFIVVLLGIILAIGGYALLRTAFFPVIFLISAIPLPYFVNSHLSLQLQLISSRLGTFFIGLFQVPVYLDGNVIDLGLYKLQVVDACSGLRYLFPLLSLSFLAAYLFRAPIWQRALVLLSSIPISILMNGFRIGMVGVTVDRWGPQMADEVLHFFEGWIVFLASTLLLTFEIYVLARISGRGFLQAIHAQTGTTRLSTTASREAFDRWPLYASLLLICTTVPAVSLIANRPEVIPERSRFVTFPATIGEWHGQPSLLDPQTERSLAMEDYILSDYSNPNGKIVNLYVGYYASQRTGESPHSPLFCLPGDGWSIIKLEQATYDAEHPINRALIEKNGEKQLVYYWYEERGRWIASEYTTRKWYLLPDAILKNNRSDGALVRLITPILPSELERDADGRLKLFMHDLLPSLTGYLPPSAAPKPQSSIRPTTP
ncbi:membrane protein [Bradyrhizobium sp. LTSPM299]|nr:membrane protein [Bradyrhizobium sp. LTSPM299]